MILLADSGSTKTDWILLDDLGETLAFQSVGFNPFYQDQAAIAAGLRAEVFPNVGGTVLDIFFYGAGCADAATSRPVAGALAEVFPAARSIEVASDLLAAARALCGHEAGIACILGTGANNCQYDGREIVNNVGSLGFWLGDEGSGGYLGKQLVVHYLQNELPADLHQEFQAAYPELTRLTMLDNAYRQPFPNRYFAGFAQFVGKHKAHDFIRKMVADAFGLFLDKYVVKHPNAATLPVHFTGSVAYHFGDILQEALAIKNLRPGQTQKSPMSGLLRFHQNFPDKK